MLLLLELLLPGSGLLRAAPLLLLLPALAPRVTALPIALQPLQPPTRHSPGQAASNLEIVPQKDALSGGCEAVNGPRSGEGRTLPAHLRRALPHHARWSGASGAVLTCAASSWCALHVCRPQAHATDDGKDGSPKMCS
jgi:hypothetical protein